MVEIFLNKTFEYLLYLYMPNSCEVTPKIEVNKKWQLLLIYLDFGLGKMGYL